jgi:hypothetical protein
MKWRGDVKRLKVMKTYYRKKKDKGGNEWKRITEQTKSRKEL